MGSKDPKRKRSILKPNRGVPIPTPKGSPQTSPPKSPPGPVPTDSVPKPKVSASKININSSSESNVSASDIMASRAKIKASASKTNTTASGPSTPFIGRSKSKVKRYKSSKSKVFKGISFSDLKYVPDPLTKKPPEYYIQDPPLAYELRYNPFTLLFKSGSVPISRITDIIFFLLNFLQTVPISAVIFIALYEHGFVNSIQSLAPGIPDEFPEFATNIMGYLERTNMLDNGNNLLLIGCLQLLITGIGCLAVYHGRSKILVGYLILLFVTIGTEWYYVHEFYDHSDICSHMTDLNGAMWLMISKYQTHGLKHSNYGPHVVIDEMQLSLACCGVDGPLDYLGIPRGRDPPTYPLPNSCCAQAWVRNIYCSNVGDLDKDNPEFTNKINQKGCYGQIMWLCQLTTRLLTEVLLYTAIVHSILYVLIIIAALAELSMLKTMVISCNKIEFALRSYVIPDEPLLRRKVHEFGNLPHEHASHSGLTLDPNLIPPEFQEKMQAVRERFGIGTERFGMELENKIREELRREAELRRRGLDEEEEEEELIAATGVPQMANFDQLIDRTVKYLLPINDESSKFLAQALDEQNEKAVIEMNYEEERAHRKGLTNLRLAEIEEIKAPSPTPSFTKPRLSDKELITYGARERVLEEKKKKILKLNRWTWKSERHESVTSIPSDPQIPKTGVLTKKGKRHVDLHKQMFHVRYPGSMKRPKKKPAPLHPMEIDPEELFRSENEAQIKSIMREADKLVNEENKIRRRFLERVAQQKIEEIRRQEQGRKIVVLDDKAKGPGNRSESFEVDKFRTPHRPSVELKPKKTSLKRPKENTQKEKEAKNKKEADSE